MKFLKHQVTFASCCGAICLHEPIYLSDWYNRGVRLSFQPLPVLPDMRYETVTTSEGILYLEFPTKLEGYEPSSYKKVKTINWDVYFPEVAKVNKAYQAWASANRGVWQPISSNLELTALRKNYIDLNNEMNGVAFPTAIEHFSISNILNAPSAYKDKVGVCILSDHQKEEDDADLTEENVKEALGDRLIYQSQKFWNLGYPEFTDPYLTLFIFEKK